MTCISLADLRSNASVGFDLEGRAASHDEVSRPTRSLPKWQIVGGKSLAAASKPLQRPVASLKPGSAPQKATLLTKEGPIDVSLSPIFWEKSQHLGG